MLMVEERSSTLMCHKVLRLRLAKDTVMLQVGIGDDGAGLYDSGRAHMQPYKRLTPAGHVDASSVRGKQVISVL